MHDADVDLRLTSLRLLYVGFFSSGAFPGIMLTAHARSVVLADNSTLTLFTSSILNVRRIESSLFYRYNFLNPYFYGQQRMNTKVCLCNVYAPLRSSGDAAAAKIRQDQISMEASSP